MKDIEVQAKTIEQAIEEGLAKLGAKEEDVTVQILGQGGMFKKAKVKLTLKKAMEEKKPEPKPEKKPEKKPEAKIKPEPKPATVATPGEGSHKVDTCVNFVKGLLAALNSESTVSVESTTETHTININGGDVGRLIGKGGEAMYALQTLVTTLAISNQNGDTRRVYVNIEGYKEKRDETLKSLAQRKAEYVLKSGRYVKMEPMTPRDRAIMHNALQEIEGVRSFSTGQGTKRQLVIAPAKEEEK